MTSVFVTRVPTFQVSCPVREMFTPLSVELFRIKSGVSPCGICQTISPLSMLIADIVPYGGLIKGRPSMVKAFHSSALAAFPAGLGASALELVPAALIIRGFLPAVPYT